jgi:transposase
MYNPSMNGSLPETTVVTKSAPSRKTSHNTQEQRFCPSMFCFTDEILVQRISAQADVWVLTDAVEDHAWFMMGEAPTCPHCGTVLLPANNSR